MKKLSLIQTILAGFLAACTLGLAIFSLNEYHTAISTVSDSENLITLSHDSGFYTDSFILEISGNGISELYYTLDGSAPSRDNPAALVYSRGIPVECGETETAFTIRLLACFKDGSVSDIISRTFVTGSSVKERYEVPVLFLTGDEKTFFDETEGLLMGENRYARGAETEREVFMTLFSPDGTVLLSQGCGVRIHGAYSRKKNQPSFRLYARSEYDTQNHFEYAFFDNQYTFENALATDAKRIIVRSSGNDNGYAFMRSELATRLALDAGYPDVPSASPVAVYLNNTYYGSYWFVTQFDETYFKSTYGEYEGTMYMLEGKVYEMTPEENETDQLLISLMESYNEKHAFFSTVDLNQEENWQALNDFMDVENFLQHMAIQNYLSNLDCLRNNYKIYRYVAPEGGTYTADSVFDGRYRLLLYDLDYAFGFNLDGEMLATSDRLEDPDKKNILFVNILSRKDCREYYIRYTLSLQNHYFSYDYAMPILEQMHNSRAKELYYTYTTTELTVDNHSAPDVTCEADIQRELDRLRNYLAIRKDYITQDMIRSFGAFTTYDLLLSNPDKANITLDFAVINQEEFSGMYYKELPLTISASPRPGYQFDYWLINGEYYGDSSVEITASMITEDYLTVACCCSPDPDAGICITAIKANTGNDYLELTNLGTTSRYLNSYYLTDDDTWNKSSLPALLLEAGESITIYCKNYTGLEALGQPCINFNLSAGEVLSLYQSGKACLQTVTIPDMGTEEGIYSMNRDDGSFYEIIPE